MAGSRCNPASNLLALLVEKLVTELAVKTLDVTVLHGAPWLDRDVANSMSLRPSEEHSTCEFRPVIGPNHLRVARKQGCLIQQLVTY